MKVLILGGVAAGKVELVKRILEKIGDTESVMIVDKNYGLELDDSFIDEAKYLFTEPQLEAAEIATGIINYFLKDNLKQQYEKPKNQTLHRNHRAFYRSIHYRNKKPKKRM